MCQKISQGSRQDVSTPTLVTDFRVIWPHFRNGVLLPPFCDLQRLTLSTMPVRVFTDAQLDLLKELLPEFIELQKNGSSLGDFWEKALHEYFEENPGPESDYQAPAPAPKMTKGGKASKRQMTSRPPPKTKVFESVTEWKKDRQTVSTVPDCDDIDKLMIRTMNRKFVTGLTTQQTKLVITGSLL